MYVCITTYPYVCTHSLMMYVYDDLILYLYIEDGGMCCITCIRPSLILCHFRANFYAYAHELNHARAPSLFTASGETWLRQQSSRAYHAQFRPRLLCRARLARLLNRRSFHLPPPSSSSSSSCYVGVARSRSASTWCTRRWGLAEVVCRFWVFLEVSDPCKSTNGSFSEKKVQNR